VTISLREHGVRGVVLDIEGTTTPVSFVYDTLFPYARERIADAIAANGAFGDAIRLLEAERAVDAAPHVAPGADLAAYIESLMAHDSKSPALKTLQGLIWERGFRDGTLHGIVFPDVPPALQRWHGAGVGLAIYSSGSALAQRLLFSTTSFGDFTPLFEHFFDTSVGAKRDAASYARIAKAMTRPASSLLFVSDVAAELDAAAASGFQAALCVRPGNTPQPTRSHITVRTLDEIVT
jgi:enolase-phosphatase E1